MEKLLKQVDQVDQVDLVFVSRVTWDQFLLWIHRKTVSGQSAQLLTWDNMGTMSAVEQLETVD